ncbi:unnamed protein product [Mortierella alpina]
MDVSTPILRNGNLVREFGLAQHSPISTFLGLWTGHTGKFSVGVCCPKARAPSVLSRLKHKNGHYPRRRSPALRFGVIISVPFQYKYTFCPLLSPLLSFLLSRVLVFVFNQSASLSPLFPALFAPLLHARRLFPCGIC